MSTLTTINKANDEVKPKSFQNNGNSFSCICYTKQIIRQIPKTVEEFFIACYIQILGQSIFRLATRAS